MNLHYDLSRAWQLFVSSGLLMHEIYHLLFAAPFAMLLYLKSGKHIRLVILLFLVTILIDLDHLADYFLYYGVEFNLDNFLNLKYLGFGKQIEWAFVPFHAWEWLILLLFINIRKNWTSSWRALVFGYMPHLILDSINVGSFIFYSISYRFIFIYNLL